MTDGPILDIFAGLNHKAGMGDTAGGIDGAPGYLDDDQNRRFNAYLRIAAYIESSAREYLAENPDDPDRQAQLREFGDPAVLVERVAAAVLGSDPSIGVVGADQAIPDSPDLGPFPETVEEGLEPDEKAIRDQVYSASVESWKSNADQIVEAWLADKNERPGMLERQGVLQEWATLDEFIEKITELETEHVVPFGSGVVVLGWSADKGRVETEIHSPFDYYPVLDEASPGEFPSKVHLAWQFTGLDDAGDEKEFVRRITYELVPVEGEDVEPGVDVGTRPLYLEGDARWTHSCLYSNGVWLLDSFDELNGIDDGAVWGKGQWA